MSRNLQPPAYHHAAIAELTKQLQREHVEPSLSWLTHRYPLYVGAQTVIASALLSQTSLIESLLTGPVLSASAPLVIGFTTGLTLWPLLLMPWRRDKVPSEVDAQMILAGRYFAANMSEFKQAEILEAISEHQHLLESLKPRARPSVVDRVISHLFTFR